MSLGWRVTEAQESHTIRKALKERQGRFLETGSRCEASVANSLLGRLFASWSSRFAPPQAENPAAPLGLRCGARRQGGPSRPSGKGGAYLNRSVTDEQRSCQP